MSETSIKCRCNGYNADCNFCYGTGYVSGKPDLPSSLGSYSPSKKPSKEPRKPLVPPKEALKVPAAPFEIAFVQHGTDGGVHKRPRVILRVIDKLKDTRHFPPGTHGRIEAKLRAALRIEKRHFLSLIDALARLIPDGGKPAGRVAEINRYLATPGCSARFSEEDLLHLSEAWRLSGSKAGELKKPAPRKGAGSSPKTGRVLYPGRKPKAHTSHPDAEIQPKRNAFLIVKGDLSTEEIEAVRKKVNSGGYGFVYVAGSKKALRMLQDQLGIANLVPVTNEANIANLRASPAVVVIEAGSEMEPSAAPGMR